MRIIFTFLFLFSWMTTSACSQYQADGEILVTEQADWWLVARYYVTDSIHQEAEKQCDGPASLHGTLSCERVEVESGVALKCGSEYHCASTLPHISQLGGASPVFLNLLFFALVAISLVVQITKRTLTLKSSMSNQTVALIVAESLALLTAFLLFVEYSGSTEFWFLGILLLLLPFLHWNVLHRIPMLGALFEKSTEYIEFLRERKAQAGWFFSSSKAFKAEEYFYIAGFLRGIQILLCIQLVLFFVGRAIHAYMSVWGWPYIVTFLCCSGLVSWFFYRTTVVFFDTVLVPVLWVIYGSLFRIATFARSDQSLHLQLNISVFQWQDNQENSQESSPDTVSTAQQLSVEPPPEENANENSPVVEKASESRSATDLSSS